VLFLSPLEFLSIGLLAKPLSSTSGMTNLPEIMDEPEVKRIEDGNTEVLRFDLDSDTDKGDVTDGEARSRKASSVRTVNGNVSISTAVSRKLGHATSTSSTISQSSANKKVVNDTEVDGNMSSESQNSPASSNVHPVTIPHQLQSTSFASMRASSSVTSSMKSLSIPSGKSTINSSSTSMSTSLPISTVIYSTPADPATTRAQASGSAASRSSLEELNESLDNIDQILRKRGSHRRTNSSFTSGSSVSPSARRSVSDSRPLKRNSGSSESTSESNRHKRTQSSQDGSFFMNSIRNFANTISGTPASGDSTASIPSKPEAEGKQSVPASQSEPTIREDEEETQTATDNVKENVLRKSSESYDHSVYRKEKFMDTQYRYASTVRDTAFHKLFTEIPDDDRLLDDFSCALSREILLQGRLYVSEHSLCFISNLLGWVTSLVIPFDDVIHIDRRSTAGLFPNGIIIETQESKQAFASFVSRDQTLNFISTVWSRSLALRKNHSNRSSTEVAVYARTSMSSSQLSEGDILTVDDEDETECLNSEGSADEGGSSLSNYNAHSAKEEGTSSIEDKDGEDDNQYLIQGPLKHAPTSHQPADFEKNSEKYVMDQNFKAPLGYVFKVLFGKNTVYHRKIMEVSDGFDFTDYGLFQKKDDDEFPTRSFEYQKRLNFSIGPKSTTVKVTEYLKHFDVSDYVEVLTVTTTPNVPSGGSFDVRTTYVFTWAVDDMTNLKCSYWINWTSSSWIKGMIERSALSGQQKCAKDIKKIVDETIPSNSSSYIVSSTKPVVSNKEKKVFDARIVKRKKHSVQRRRHSVAPTTTSFPFSLYAFIGLFALQLLILLYLYHSNRVMLKIVESQNEILRALVNVRYEH